MLNDRYGHPAGDQILKDLVAIWQGVLRKGDFLSRTGGEEFAALIPGVDLPHTLSIAERLRQATLSHSFGDIDESLCITASFGVTMITIGSTVSDSIARADRALYAAKSAGRNCVKVCLEDILERGNVRMPLPCP